MGYTCRNVVKDGANVAVLASLTNSVVTGTGIKDSFSIQPAFMNSICIDLVCSSVTVTNAITAKLQVRYVNTQTWLDSKTVSITTDGTASIRLLPNVAGDQGFLPLKAEGRVVVTTGVGDLVTVEQVLVPAIY